ncbi:unnamed protein product [Caenorhabditis bovis]|uniref:Uncharacterized protein n=1 Tax=Caenorhabditis bovis TaxID=2654633 RepID=A0A8S1FCI7_9PELO|nr:unnamed protein product [Caenorhabditis bovis]
MFPGMKAFSLLPTILIYIQFNQFEKCDALNHRFSEGYIFNFNISLVCPYKESFKYSIKLYEMDFWTPDDFLGEIVGTSNSSRVQVAKSLIIPNDELFSFVWLFKISVDHTCSESGVTRGYKSIVDQLCIWQR